jgi:predicted  nucleic acid-binding Zn-ribbon protein
MRQPTLHEKRQIKNAEQLHKRRARNRRGQAAWRARQRAAQDAVTLLTEERDTLQQRLVALEADLLALREEARSARAELALREEARSARAELAAARAALAAENEGTSLEDILAYLDSVPGLKDALRARL